MKLEGERTLPGRPAQLWKLLLDPDVLVAAIPGCERLDTVGDDQYRGVIAAKVGSVQSQYKTTFKITDKDPPHSYRLHVQGQGSAGFVNGQFTMRLEAAEGNTRMHYSGDANVGGRLAQVGQRMVRATAETMTEKGFSNLRDRIEEEVAPEQAAAREERERGLWNSVRRVFRTLGTFLRALFRDPRRK